MVESRSHSPFHLWELTGALATLGAQERGTEESETAIGLSLVDPSENAVAQAAWLDRRFGVAAWTPLPAQGMQSSEANAWRAHGDGDWTGALGQAKQWQAEQPFSSRPAILGGYVASTALENFPEAEQILRQGLLCNGDDAMLYNNLAFVLAKQGKVGEARKLLERAVTLDQALSQGVSSEIWVCLTATRGLVEFRSGQPELGRSLYQMAITLAGAASAGRLRHIAAIYRAIEEMRIGSQDALARENEALCAVEQASRRCHPRTFSREASEGTAIRPGRADLGRHWRRLADQKARPEIRGLRMKRDFELVRKLLIFFDEKPGPEHVRIPPVAGYDDLTIKYHLVLLYGAGYLVCEPTTSSTSDRVIEVLPFELTWEGHEFLDRIRDEYIWDEIVSNIKEHGFRSASVNFVRKLADVAIRRRLGLD